MDLQLTGLTEPIMYRTMKLLLIGGLASISLSAFAADATPPPGTTTCRWVGDEKVCTTYHLAKKTYGDGHLRPEDVKQCLLDKRRVTADAAQFNTEKTAYNTEGEGINADSISIQKNGEDLQADGKKLAASRAEIEQLAKDIQESGSSGGQASHFGNSDSPAKKVDLYNKRVAEFTKAQDAYNAKIAAYNGAVNAQKERIAKHKAVGDAFDARELSLKNFADGVHQRCVEGQQVYEDDLKAAEAAVAKDDAAQKK